MNVDLARWQFAFVTVNHFFFVPVTIGLAFLAALLQTAWQRSGREEYLRLTRFFGTLLVINVAIGVVTGLVQEFQFGMNWSAYSRLVGNVRRRLSRQECQPAPQPGTMQGARRPPMAPPDAAAPPASQGN